MLLGGVVLGPGLVAALEACRPTSSSSGSQFAPVITSPADLQMEWWGDSNRANRTNQVFQLFEQKRQQYQISGQSRTWGDYWTDLGQRLSQGDLPDVIQMDMRYIDQYTNAGALLDLSRYAPQPLDLSDVDRGLMKQATIRGFHSIPIAGNIQAIVYNRTLLDQAGVGFPKPGYTWTDFANFLDELARALPNGTWPIEDHAGQITQFEIFVRQHGHEMYTSSGGIGFSRDEARAWYQYWYDLRQAGVLTPWSVAHQSNNSSITQTTGMAMRKSAMVMAYSNLLESYGAVMADAVALGSDPRGPRGVPGHYVKVSQLLSIWSKTKYRSQAAQFLDFWIHDLGAAQALGFDRGTPVSAKVSSRLLPTLTPSQQAELTFFQREQASASSKTVLDPSGAGNLQADMYPIADALTQGQITVDQAADRLMAAAAADLKTAAA